MRHLNLILFLIVGITSCSPKQDGKVKPVDESVKTVIAPSKADFITNNSVDGIAIGDNVDEFISEVKQRYTVKKEITQLEGDEYDIYNVYENKQKKYSIEPNFDQPDIIYRIWVYSSKFKTAEGIGIGSTLSEIKSKYQIESISTEDGLHVFVKEISVCFIMDTSKLPEDWWGKMDIEKIPANLAVVEIIIS